MHWISARAALQLALGVDPPELMQHVSQLLLAQAIIARCNTRMTSTTLDAGVIYVRSSPAALCVRRESGSHSVTVRPEAKARTGTPVSNQTQKLLCMECQYPRVSVSGFWSRSVLSATAAAYSSRRRARGSRNCARYADATVSSPLVDRYLSAARCGWPTQCCK